MNPEMTRELLEPGYLPLETGYRRLDDGLLLVAALTRMPGCSGKMVDWWFGWVGDTEKYKLWHPSDHIIGDWDERWRPGHYIGASHLVHEYIGGKLAKLKITFVEPKKLLDTSRFAEAKIGAAVCGRVGLLDQDVRLGYLLHLVRETEFGCEMRSRFWLEKAPDELGRGLLKHCLEEMGNLAELLPRLYQRETGGDKEDAASTPVR